jgi:hypothetical protein
MRAWLASGTAPARLGAIRLDRVLDVQAE